MRAREKRGKKIAGQCIRTKNLPSTCNPSLLFAHYPNRKALKGFENLAK
jgi:hypothetical protein